VHSRHSEHLPRGNPCRLCGQPPFRHRLYHRAIGDPCMLCGLEAKRHRLRNAEYRERHNSREDIFLGIDGEGQGRNKHRYVLLACATETGDRSWYVENQNGLSTHECLEFLTELPANSTKAFAYSIGYDLTKILQDVDEKTLYHLFRPELRARKGKAAIKGPIPVHWQGYTINLQGTKFTVYKGDRYRVIWDIWKFYQSKFVNALRDWKVGSKEMLDRMQHMKDKRADFDKESIEAVRDYCIEECRYMAELARKLVSAHAAVGLKLKSFYGAGSSASAMLGEMGIRNRIKKPPKELNLAIASAFFGGRFENSVIGRIDETVYNKDISSAYPYQLCFLPCLQHGEWKRLKHRKDLKGTTTALVRYSLRLNPQDYSWAPFPFRTKDGSITFPSTSGGGWLWRDEFLAGERLFPKGVKFEEAWGYYTECDCKPFDQIPTYYKERLKIGKEGPGIALKLGMNSCYGKLAQSVGHPLFGTFVWAGLITSGTRAQLLDLMGLHQDMRNVLMVATDGIYTREDVLAPVPRDTGTDVEILDQSTGKLVRKPLGGWESKVQKKGVFVARPGIYFPLNPTVEEIKDVRARGVGKAVVLENWKRIIESWETYGMTRNAQIANVSRFCGAKSSISRAGKPGAFTYKRAVGAEGPGSPSYGEWITRAVELSFNPMPKREGLNPDGLTLKLRALDPDVMSTPYNKALLSMEARELLQAAMELAEQPEADLTDYELEVGV
jgi:hypothetical protein